MSAEFAWSSEQVELRRTVRSFGQRMSPETEIRRLMASDPGHDPAVWARLGTDLGVLGLATAEEFGGAGDGFVSQAIVAEELGRVLLCGPFLGSIALAATALNLLDDRAVKAEYLPGIVDGTTVAAFALPLSHGVFDPAAATVTARERTSADPAADPGAGSGWVLDGRAAHVVDGAAADLVLVAARADDGIGLFLVPAGAGDSGAGDSGAGDSGAGDSRAGDSGAGDPGAGAAGLVREPMSTMDQTRRQAVLTFAGTPARRVAGPLAAGKICSDTLDAAAVLLAAEQVGAAQHLLDLSVGYAGTRLQFGRPIGSFQAVKHLCADMLVAVELARSTAYHAAWALDDGTDDPRIAASLALAVCSDAFARTARATVQVHGGIGFTWEHQAHLYLKRSVTDAALLGTATDHRERLATLVLD